MGVAAPERLGGPVTRTPGGPYKRGGSGSSRPRSWFSAPLISNRTIRTGQNGGSKFRKDGEIRSLSPLCGCDMLRRMKSLLWAAVGIMAAVVASGQTGMPSDIDAKSLTRLPPVERKDLDEKGQKIFDSLAGPNATAAPRGILGLGMYNPALADALHKLHDSVIREGTLGNRTNEIAILVATREERMSLNEWYSHEGLALKVGVEQAVIDIIKFGKEPEGLAEKDALVIRFGRELFREWHVGSETFAKAVELFGRRGVVELIGVMGDYSMVGMMLQAVDQQLPGRAALPPLVTK